MARQGRDTLYIMLLGSAGVRHALGARTLVAFTHFFAISDGRTGKAHSLGARARRSRYFSTKYLCSLLSVNVDTIVL